MRRTKILSKFYWLIYCRPKLSFYTVTKINLYTARLKVCGDFLPGFISRFFSLLLLYNFNAFTCISFTVSHLPSTHSFNSGLLWNVTNGGHLLKAPHKNGQLKIHTKKVQPEMKTYGDFMFNILTRSNLNKLWILQMTKSKDAALKGIHFITPYNF